jgi:hypothetical protein
VKVILSILRKEFIQLRRDPRLFPVIFISPILQLVLLGYAANLDVKNIPSVVCDLDRSAASREFLDNFINSGYFSVEATVERMDEIDRFLDHGDAAAWPLSSPVDSAIVWLGGGKLRSCSSSTARRASRLRSGSTTGR